MTQEADPGLFRETISDLPLRKGSPKERDLEGELFGRKGVKERVDDFERELGIGVNKKPAVENVKYRNKIFNPKDDEDRQLLNDLLNDKTRFKIVMWNANWSSHGDYKVFVIYAEDMDATSKMQGKAAKSEEESEQP